MAALGRKIFDFIEPHVGRQSTVISSIRCDSITTDARTIKIPCNFGLLGSKEHVKG